MTDSNKNFESEGQPKGKGPIYNLIGFLGSNKTTVYLVTFLLTIAGYSIFNNLPKEQFPDIVIPQIYVNTVYAGTAPADIENLINKPLEKQIKSEQGVKTITSNALQDVSVILVEFNTNVDVQVAKDRVKNAIDKARRDLPNDLTQDPTAMEVNFSEFPIMNINLSGDFPLDKIKSYGEDIQDRIEELPEITRVDIVGALEREIQINLDLQKMQSYGLTFYDIQSAVQNENINISAGELNVDNVRRTLRIKGEFQTIEQLRNVIVTSGTGASAHLYEIAEVVDSNAERQDFARLDNEPVITLNVIKRSGENLIAASEQIGVILDEFKEKAPSGLNVTITADQSDRTKADINDLINTVVMGFIFVVLVLMFFMGVRDAIFVGLSVPLSALLAFYPLMAMGFTLNTIVLFAFLLGLGIVVDDAIVVIENSHRIFNKHKDLSITEAVKLAASEVFIPVLAGTLTTIAPFFPLLFWPGMVGEFMKYLPFTLIFTLFASLVVSYIMNPVFAMTFMKREDEDKEKDSGFASIKRTLIILGVIAVVFYLLYAITGVGTVFGVANVMVLLAILVIFNHFILTPKLIIPFQENLLPKLKDSYSKTIRWILEGYRPIWAVLASFVLLILTFVFMGIKKPNVVFFPSAEPDYIYVYNVMPIGTDARKTDDVTKEIERRVFKVLEDNNAMPAVNSVISNVGRNAGDPMNPDRSDTPHKSKVTVAFVGKESRGGVSSLKLLNEVRESLIDIPGTSISVERESNGPPTGKPITIEITGEDFEILSDIESKVFAKIEASNIPGIDELKSDLVTNKPEIVVNVDREKASREGISTTTIAMALRTALFGSEISKFRDLDDEYPIQLRLEQSDRSDIEKLLSMNITYRDMNMGGVLRSVPLSTVADISYSTTFSQINRTDAKRTITLSSDVTPEYAEQATKINEMIFAELSDLDLPAGYTIDRAGEQKEQEEAMAFLSKAFLIAIAIIYLILAAQFNSIIKPFIIFFTIVLSLIGVLLGFLIFNKTFSVIMSGVGIIALAGIVVKNGILLIEFIDEMRKRGYSVKEAIIEGGSTRLTPVLLTAFSTILGMIPLAIGLAFDFGALFVDLDWVVHIGGDSAVFWNILAWTIIFGLAFSTVLTLIIVPCLYYISDRIQKKLRGEEAIEREYLRGVQA
ncbi:efflux RND transporter permease subunit [Jiulongibacter sediminis]|jgi:multidrug efflux pump subunit AcrB|uniref:efflux RND transporter permease subunit n=1 Tax=Jiulongibacter sediminis TaxID=1605367 RepID=UPI0026EE7475|nr:efflux RND transporter permease subunit [Jiulongibacter sediminis]